MQLHKLFVVSLPLLFCAPLKVFALQLPVVLAYLVSKLPFLPVIQFSVVFLFLTRPQSLLSDDAQLLGPVFRPPNVVLASRSQLSFFPPAPIAICVSILLALFRVLRLN